MTTKYLRFSLELAIPEDPKGVDWKGIKLPLALVGQLPTIITGIRQLKSLARRINEGKDNEESTVRATWHICYHELPEPRPVCEEKEI